MVMKALACRASDRVRSTPWSGPATGLLKTKARIARKHRSWIAVANAADEVRLDSRAREKGLIHTGVVEARHPARIQMAEKPPSTFNSTPFTKLESSEARNSATAAISSGRPIFPRGISDFEHLPRFLVESLESGVSTCPGLSTFTRQRSDTSIGGISARTSTNS